LGGSDGDEAVSPNLAGEGRCDCIMMAAAAGAANGHELEMLVLDKSSQASTSWAHEPKIGGLALVVTS
jgi:hypothetical protein